MAEDLLYEGKAKKVFTTDDDGVLLHSYKDDATAFNAQKRGAWKDKGKTNATMSAAICAGYFVKSASTDSRLLKSATRVSLTVSAGTPGESGKPRVATPEPACTRSRSAWLQTNVNASISIVKVD